MKNIMALIMSIMLTTVRNIQTKQEVAFESAYIERA